MPTVKLVDENSTNPIVQAVFRDIKETKKIDFVPNIWRALASHPEHLQLCWTHVGQIMSNFISICFNRLYKITENDVEQNGTLRVSWSGV